MGEIIKRKSTSGTGAGNTYAVPALEKAAEILELLASQPAGLSATEIAARLGRSMGEIYRVIIALERLRYITKESDLDRYSLSLKLFELAHRHPPTTRLIHAAIPILEKLSANTDQSSHLGVLQNGCLVILAQVDSPQQMRYSVKIGATLPTLETSSGVVILAFSDLRTQESYLEPLDDTARAQMLERFNSARRLGYERWRSSVVTGVVNLSAPIFNHAGVPQGAITIPYLTQKPERINIDQALGKVVAAADGLSRSLGWPGSHPL
jgi:DNA-binding IclR family transcriptional regulator